MDRKLDVVVIGAGHNGLVAAGYLARAGLKVLVLERRELVGGVLVTEEFYPGFKIDTCVHGIGWMPPRIVRDLGLKEFGFEQVQSEITVFSPSTNGTSLQLWRNVEKSRDAIRQFSPADADRWPEFVRLAANVGEVLEAAYSTAPPDLSLENLSGILPVAKTAFRLRRLGQDDMSEVLRSLPMPVTDLLDDWFEAEILKATLAAYGIRGVFQGPRAPGTSFPFFHHHVGAKKSEFGAQSFVRGGVGNFSNALAASARRYGADIRTGMSADQILITDRKAVGVVLENGRQFSADYVLSSANPHTTFIRLVGSLHLDQEFSQAVQNIRYNGAMAKINFALNDLPSFSSLPGNGPHLRSTISLSPSMDYLERAYDDAKYGRPSQNPYLELMIPSLFDETLAPKGKHVMSAIVKFAPYRLKSAVWDDSMRTALLESAVDTLAEYIPNIAGVIEYAQVLTPLDLEEIFDLPEGNIYHGDLALNQAYIMRPVPGWARYQSPIKNLYLCGAGTHPGGGIAGAPGFLASKEVLKAAKQRRG